MNNTGTTRGIPPFLPLFPFDLDLMKHTKGQDVELERALKYLTALAVAMNNCQQ